MRPSNTARPGEAGFTLIEVLSALVIIGLMSGAVLMTLPKPKPAALTYAADINRALSRAAQSSLTRGQAYGFGLSETGYAIFAYEDEVWSAVGQGAAGGGIKTSLSIEGRKAKLPDRPAPMIVFEPTGINPPFVVSLAGDEIRMEITASGAGTFEVTQP